MRRFYFLLIKIFVKVVVCKAATGTEPTIFIHANLSSLDALGPLLHSISHDLYTLTASTHGL